MRPLHAWLLAAAALAGLASAGSQPDRRPGDDEARGTLRLYSAARKDYVMVDKVEKPADEWRRQLSPEEYHVTRQKGTERAFTGRYWNTHDAGVYKCVCCGNDLFSSETKYDSGTGWPSFWAPIAPENVATEEDRSLFMSRTEVTCSRCGAHLGHVFDDGPRPTGQRFCMNSAALRLEKTPGGDEPAPE
jgi:peptide-methionine (R)-S-oxide reductase